MPVHCDSHLHGIVLAVNISDGGIPKLACESIAVTSRGLAGDAHDHDKHNTPVQAVSLIDVENLRDLCTEGFDLVPGATGENVTIEGLDVDALPIGAVLHFSGGLVVEITKRRNPCFVLDAIDPTLKIAMRGRCGMYAKVRREATLAAGEIVKVVSLPGDHEPMLFVRHAIEQPA